MKDRTDASAHLGTLLCVGPFPNFQLLQSCDSTCAPRLGVCSSFMSGTLLARPLGLHLGSGAARCP